MPVWRTSLTELVAKKKGWALFFCWRHVRKKPQVAPVCGVPLRKRRIQARGTEESHRCSSSSLRERPTREKRSLGSVNKGAPVIIGDLNDLTDRGYKVPTSSSCEIGERARLTSSETLADTRKKTKFEAEEANRSPRWHVRKKGGRKREKTKRAHASFTRGEGTG